MQKRWICEPTHIGIDNTYMTAHYDDIRYINISYLYCFGLGYLRICDDIYGCMRGHFYQCLAFICVYTLHFSSEIILLWRSFFITNYYVLSFSVDNSLHSFVLGSKKQWIQLNEISRMLVTSLYTPLMIYKLNMWLIARHAHQAPTLSILVIFLNHCDDSI